MSSHARVFLQVEIPDALSSMVGEVVAFLPRLVGAILILVIGWVIGVGVARVVSGLADRTELDQLVLDTPLGRFLGGTERAVSRTFGATAKWFVVADFIGDAIMRTRAATQTAYTSWFAAGTRLFLYFTAVVIGLDTMGVDVSILLVFARALAYGLGAAIALGLGIAVGWGGRRYVADNVDRWMGEATSNTPRPSGSPEADGGTQDPRTSRSREPPTPGNRAPPAPADRDAAPDHRGEENERDGSSESAAEKR